MRLTPSSSPIHDAPLRRLARALLAPLAISCVLAMFFAPALAGRGQFLSRDAGRLHAPVKRWVAERLSRGELPEWNPYDGLGAPVVAAAVDAVQHPFNLLLVALPFDPGFKAWVLLSYWLAASGAYAWARAMRRSRLASLAGALAFALSGVLVSTSDNLTYLSTFAALPWVLAAGLRLAEHRSVGRLVAVALASALCAAGGDPQAWGFACLAVAIQPALLGGPPDERGSGRSRLGLGLLALAAALVGAAPFVLPVALWIPHSSRAVQLGELDRVRFALAPLRLPELVIPGLTRGEPGYTLSEVYRRFTGDPTGGPWYVSVYAGASVVALAGLGARRERRARRLLVAAAALTWMALGHHAGFGQLAAHLPVLSSVRFWEKLTIWPTLLLAGAAAHGLDAVRPAETRVRAFPWVTAGIALAAGALALVGILAPGALAGMVGSGPAGGAPEVSARFARNVCTGGLHAAVALACVGLASGILRRRRPPGALALLSLTVVLDVAVGNAGAWTLSPPALGDPRGPVADLLASASGLQRLVSPFEITERHHPSFAELTPAQEAWCVGGRLLYAAFNVAREVGNFEPGSPMAPERVAQFVTQAGPARLLPAAGLFGVGYVVVPRAPAAAGGAGLPPPYDVAAIDPAIPAYLVRVPHRPRSYLAPAAAPATRAEAFAFAAAWSAATPDLTLVEGPVPAGWRGPPGEVRFVRDDPEDVELAVRAETRALLVLSDAFARGWTATIDGRPVEIYPANALGRAVWVEGGDHLVSFRYRTPGLRLGWSMFFAGMIAAGLWAVTRGRRRARPSAGGGGAHPSPRGGGLAA